MSDLKKMSMSELIAKHNELADALGVSQEHTFKNMAAARSAVTTLENKMSDATNSDPSVDTSADTAPADGAGASTDGATPSDKAKYNSSGKRGPTQGVGEFAKSLIAEGKDNQTVLDAVREKFPSAKTSKGCIAFYRTAMSKGPAQADPAALRAQAQALMDKADAAEAERAQAEAEAAAQAEAEAAAATA